MSEHWNIQIHVQKVAKETRTGPLGAHHHEREVTEVLDLKVTADSEVEAYLKVRRLLAASAGVPE